MMDEEMICIVVDDENLEPSALAETSSQETQMQAIPRLSWTCNDEAVAWWQRRRDSISQ